VKIRKEVRERKREREREVKDGINLFGKN